MANKDIFAAGSEESSSLETLAWTMNRFGKDAVFSCSFGAEDMVILHLLSTLKEKDSKIPDIITLDTGRLNEETYQLIDQVIQKYGFSIKFLHPDADGLNEIMKDYGPNLFYRSVELRKKCCEIRKVIPLNIELSKRKAWITGLRKEQSVDRSDIQKIMDDPDRDWMIKISPLADWTEEQVWAYIRQNSIPYNSLHDRGFPSIGCAPCTRAIVPGEDSRAGRWWWETGKKECGIHRISPVVHHINEQDVKSI